MAKAKTPKDIVVEYFEGIKYYREGDKLIVILPEGLKVRESKLLEKEKTVDLEMFIEELSGSCLFVAQLESPPKVKELLVLQAEDAKGFCG